jgi:hypothetical protein
MDKTKTCKLNRGLAALFLTLLCCAFLPWDPGTGCIRASAAQTETPSQNTEAQGQNTEAPGPSTEKEDPETQAGTIKVLVEGAFEEPDREAILARINAIRKEACEEGVRDPATGEVMQAGDYIPLVWSYELEEVAMRRAVESAVLRDHMRPDGTECFSILPDSEAFSMETLAWGYGGMLEAVEGWYSEKSSYVEETGAPAGHYMALISPAIRYAAVAGFAPGSGQDACAGAFGRSDPSTAAEKLQESAEQLGTAAESPQGTFAEEPGAAAESPQDTFAEDSGAGIEAPGTGEEERADVLRRKTRWEIPVNKALLPSAARLALARVIRMVTTGMERIWITSLEG